MPLRCPSACGLLMTQPPARSRPGFPLLGAGRSLLTNRLRRLPVHCPAGATSPGAGPALCSRFRLRDPLVSSQCLFHPRACCISPSPFQTWLSLPSGVSTRPPRLHVCHLHAPSPPREPLRPFPTSSFLAASGPAALLPSKAPPSSLPAAPVGPSGQGHRLESTRAGRSRILSASVNPHAH